MAMDLALQGKKVLVTAGTKGIGEAVVTLLRDCGATVLASARSRPASLPEELFVAADLTTIQGCNMLVDAVNSRFGGVDIIIHVLGAKYKLCSEEQVYPHTLGTSPCDMSGQY